MDSAETQARERFGARLADAGLQDVRRVGEDTMAVETGQEASLVEYRRAFAFDGGDVSGLGSTLDLPGDRIDIAGHLSTWYNGSNVLVAVGVHATESDETTVTDGVDGE